MCSAAGKCVVAVQKYRWHLLIHVVIRIFLKKTTMGKFLHDQNRIVQFFVDFNHACLFIGILTLVQMRNMALKIMAIKLACCKSEILLFELMYSSANRTKTHLYNGFKPPSS